MSTLKKISIVIPIYNESENIIVLLKELLKILDTISGGEIIIVDDCSTDNGAELVLKHAEYRENIILLAHAKRLGQSACLLTAIKHSKHDIIITLDGDGQNDPEDIKNMLSYDPVNCNCSCVCCDIFRKRADLGADTKTEVNMKKDGASSKIVYGTEMEHKKKVDKTLLFVSCGWAILSVLLQQRFCST